MNVYDKLECVSLASLSSLVVGKGGANHRVEHLKGASLG
jgi:hypothetical protein